MRAGFHRILGNSKRGAGLQWVSQSLVNEGRFPQEVKVEVKEREVKMFVAIPR